jgi:predicted ATPase
MQEALALARELSHPFSLAPALDHAAWLHQYRWEGRLTQEQVEVAMALSTEQGFPFLLATGTIMRGWALAEQGRRAEGMAQMHQGMAALRAIGVALLLPRGHTLLAEALATTHQQGLHLWEPELYRVKGELLLRQAASNQEEAETCFRQALEVSRQQQAKTVELRAAISLARLWQRQGKRAEARELLAPIYDWFTEGFDTADLQDAKALLEA